MCEHTDKPAPECMNRTFEKFNPSRIEQYFEEDLGTNTILTWYKWGGIQVVDENHIMRT